MFFAVLGTPSPLTAAVLKVVQALAETALGSYYWIAAGTADDLRKAWAQRGEKPVVMFADIPSQDITRMVVDANIPVVVCLEPPAAIVDHLARTRDLTGLPALRLASQSLGTLHDIALDTTTYTLTPSIADVEVSELVEGLARIYGLSLDKERLAEVIKKKLHIDANGTTLRAIMPSGPGGPSTADMALAASALDGYTSLLNGKAAERFTWATGVFLGAKPHGEPITGPIELIGGRRCFAFGPYFHLPSGAWRVSVDFEIANNVSGNILKIDAYTDRTIEEGAARLPRDGRFTSSFDIAIEEPRLPLQIRLSNEEGAIEGRFILHAVVVERIH